VHPLLEQLPTLLGVLLGAVATYGVTALSERRRWHREQAVRWDQRRVTAYMEYAHAVKKVISIAMRLAAQRGVTADQHFMAPEYQLADMAAAEEARTVCWESVLLLGSDEAVQAGRRWHECVFRLELVASGQPADMSWAEAVQATSVARGGFYAAAKRDIGLDVRELSDYEWQIGDFWNHLTTTSPDPGAPSDAPMPR
jgi:hypothetical protein